MKTSFRKKVRCTLLFVGLAAVYLGHVSDALSQLPADTPSKLQDIKDRLLLSLRTSGSVSAQYTIEFEYRTPNLQRPVSLDATVQLDGRRFRIEKRRHFPAIGDNPPHTADDTLVCDGEVCYLSSGQTGQNPLIEKFSPTNVSARVTPLDCRYFQAAGLPFPTVVYDWSISPGLKSEVLSCIEEGALIDTDWGKDLIRLRFRVLDPVVKQARDADVDLLAEWYRAQGASRKSVEEQIAEIKMLRDLDAFRLVTFDLDPGREYSVVRRVDTTTEDKMIQEVFNSDFLQIADGVWLPQKCEVRTYLKMPDRLQGFTDVPIVIERFTVNQLTLDENEATAFQIVPQPGAGVIDRADSAKGDIRGARLHIQPAANNDLRNANQARVPFWSRPTTWLIGGNFFALLLAGIVAIRLRKRQATDRNAPV